MEPGNLEVFWWFTSADELANVKRRLDECHEKVNLHIDKDQQIGGDRADRQVNEVRLLQMLLCVGRRAENVKWC